MAAPGPRPSKPPHPGPIYFWENGVRFIDAWAMDGRPFPSNRFMNRVNGFKWLATWGLTLYGVFAADWGGEDHVFAAPQRWARRRVDSFWE